jgi:hypothetical protein
VVNELLDDLRDTKFFSKLDLRSSYHQVLMHLDNMEKTMFLVMMFRLTNAIATFQVLMNDVLRPYLHRFILIFMTFLSTTHHGRNTSATSTLSSPSCKNTHSSSRGQSVHLASALRLNLAMLSRRTASPWTRPGCRPCWTGHAHSRCE